MSTWTRKHYERTALILGKALATAPDKSAVEAVEGVGADFMMAFHMDNLENFDAALFGANIERHTRLELETLVSLIEADQQYFDRRYFSSLSDDERDARLAWYKSRLAGEL